jgi:hypothetical protein
MIEFSGVTMLSPSYEAEYRRPIIEQVVEEKAGYIAGSMLCFLFIVADAGSKWKLHDWRIRQWISSLGTLSENIY